MSAPYFPSNVFDDPRQMPELRHALLTFTEHPAWAQAEMLRRMSVLCGNASGRTVMRDVIHASDDGDSLTIMGPEGYTADEIPKVAEFARQQAMAHLDWHYRCLHDAQLVHVAADLSDVLYASADTVPGDTVLEAHTPPTPAGLVVFSTPFIGMDADNGGDDIRVDAVLWGPSRLPRRDQYRLGGDGVLPAFSFSTFRWLDPANQDDEVARQTAAGGSWRRALDHPPAMWLPLGRSDWLVGDRLDAPCSEGIDVDGNVHASMMEDRRLLAALWALIRSKRVVQRTMVAPSRSTSRRLDRAGDTTDREVVVVHLRAREYAPTHDDGSTGRRVGVRFVVRPHWRNQAYGPNRSLRRLTLIPPHLKGPEGAPLQHTERVWSIDS